MLSVIIPVKNEPNLEPFLSSVHEVLADIPDSYEVLVAQGDRETKNYSYPQFPHQRTIWTYGDSLERSILGGFSHAKGDKIIVMDADGSHQPNAIPEMWRLLDDYEMVVGSRYMDQSNYETGVIRQLFSNMGKQDAHEAGSRLSDPMSGFFAIRQDVLKRCVFKPLLWKVALEVDLRAKPKLIEIPINFAERKHGISKNRFLNALKIHFQLMWEELS